MDWPATLAAALGFAAVAAVCGWAGARAPNPHRGPRLAPYRLMMLLAAVGLLLMLVHMLNLAGVTTGR